MEVLVIDQSLKKSMVAGLLMLLLYVIGISGLVGLQVRGDLASNPWVDRPLEVLDIPIADALGSHRVQGWFLPSMESQEEVDSRWTLFTTLASIRWLLGGPIYFLLGVLIRLLAIWIVGPREH